MFGVYIKEYVTQWTEKFVVHFNNNAVKSAFYDPLKTFPLQ